MEAHAGYMPAPEDISPVNQFTKSGRFRSVIKAGDQEWDLSTGWHHEREAGWRSKVSKKGRSSREYIAANGQVYKVYNYDYNGNNDYVGFRSNEHTSQRFRDRIAWAEQAFKNGDNVAGPVEGCGHIAEIAYARNEQILKVKFENNNAICLFFRVPTTVAGTLLAYAIKKYTVGINERGGHRGRERHLLGVEFWNLVRIRGHRVGARYPFEYESHGTGKVISSEGRHVIRWGPKTMLALLSGAKTYSDKSSNYLKRIQEEMAKRNFDPTVEGEEFITTLSDEEFTDMAQFISDIANQKQGLPITPKEAGGQLDALLNKQKSKIDDFLHSPAAEMLLAAADIDAGKLDRDLIKQYINENDYDNTMSALIDKRSGKPKQLNSIRAVKNLVEVLDPNGEVLTWYHKGDKRTNAVGRTWTVQQLVDFSNPTIEGNISLADAPTYKQLIKKHDWKGALDFLQTHNHELFFVDPKTGFRKSLGLQKYAGENDVLAKE